MKANADELVATLKSKSFNAFVVLEGGMFRRCKQGLFVQSKMRMTSSQD
ncbi:hypothetical protein ACEQPO_14395 [Bacillus sp. SL00103]